MGSSQDFKDFKDFKDLQNIDGTTSKVLLFEEMHELTDLGLRLKRSITT